MPSVVAGPWTAMIGKKDARDSGQFYALRHQRAFLWFLLFGRGSLYRFPIAVNAYEEQATAASGFRARLVMLVFLMRCYLIADTAPLWCSPTVTSSQLPCPSPNVRGVDISVLSYSRRSEAS